MEQRLFVALDLPAHVRDVLTSLPLDTDVWRPVPQASLHVTLVFLGARPPADVDRIRPVVEAERDAPKLSLGDVLLLPPRRPRVLTVAIDGPLTGLQTRVAEGLEAAGVYTLESRPFRAHVVLARLRPRVRAPRTADIPLEPLAFSGQAVTLYVSRLHPLGARYEPLVSAGLR